MPCITNVLDSPTIPTLMQAVSVQLAISKPIKWQRDTLAQQICFVSLYQQNHFDNRLSKERAIKNRGRKRTIYLAVTNTAIDLDTTGRRRGCPEPGHTDAFEGKSRG
jgi:hypothetical protein